MKTLKFKTNARCSGCTARMAEVLDGKVGKENWSLDLESPDKVLTVTSELSAEEIISLISALRFKIELIG